MDESLALDSIADGDIAKLLGYGESIVLRDKAEINMALHKVVDQVIGEEKQFKC
jgi:hypothetical protein